MAEPKLFLPLGGMNQDSSLVVPDAETGKSPFQQGDYRYALNARIGSSRNDNFGSLETLKDTAEVTSYYRRSQIILNSDFTSDLSSWSQLDDAPGVPGYTAWTQSLGYATVTVDTPNLTSKVLYQTGLELGNKITVEIGYPYFNTLVGTIKIVFLFGSAVLEEIEYETSDFTNFRKVLNVPDTADGIGIRVIADAVDTAEWSLDSFKVYSWVTASAPTGNEKTIGKFEDREFLKYFYCNWNSNGDHTLRVYDYTTDSVYELLKWSGLNWEQSYFVKLAKLDNWLCITDRNNKPLLIDTDDIMDLFLRLGESEFREFNIMLHKWAPTLAPILKRVFDTGDHNKELYRKQFDFTYRYVYYGGLRSRWSPIAVCHGFLADYNKTYTTDPTISYISIFLPGMFLDQPGVETEWNYFDHTDNKFLKAVEYIEIAYREGELDLWKIFKRKKTNDGISNVNFIFRNDVFLSFASSEDLYQPQDVVPLKSGTVEAIDNRFVLGDNLNEYPYWNGLQIESASINKLTGGNPWNYTEGGPSSLFQSLNYLQQLNLKERAKYKIGFQFLYPEGRKSLVYTDEKLAFTIPSSSVVDGTPYTQPVCSFSFKLSDTCKPPVDAVAVQLMRTNAIGVESFLFGMINEFTALVDDPTALLDDLGITNSVVRDRLDTHFNNLGVINSNDVSDALSKPVDIRLINPTTKTTKKLLDLMKNNSVSTKIQADIRATKDILITDSQYCSRLLLNINNWYNASTTSTADRDNQLNKIIYNYRDGDRVRFIGSTESTTPTEGQKKIFDVPILEFTGTGIIIDKPEGLKWVGLDTGIEQTDYIIEVYTPITSTPEDIVFHEVGEVYPIYYPGTSKRAFSKSDWTWTNLAAVEETILPNGFPIYHNLPFFKGDTYLIFKQLYSNYVADRNDINFGYYLTSMTPFPDSIFGYWDKRNGRIAQAYDSPPKINFFNTQIRFGGKIVEQSLINQLNRYKEEDQFIYPSEYGRIREIVNTSNAQVESAGSILLVIGERETWSVYVNRTTLEDLSGKTQVALSDRVLGSFNILVGGHGTLNPESISTERGRVWFWDAIDASWIRYSRDGLTAISDNKMRNWFKEIGRTVIKEYQSDEVPVVVSGYDNFNEELIIFHNHSSMPSTFRGYTVFKGALFSEEDKRWKSCHGLQPDRIGKVETQVLMWLNGKLFKYEAGESYNTFFSVKQDVEIEPVFTDLAIKSWQTISLAVTHGWSVESFKSEYRGEKTIQESRIPLTSFVEKEDNLVADIKSDLNSVNVADPILDGKKMRSKALRVLLKLDPSVVTLSLLNYVSVGYIDSPKN